MNNRRVGRPPRGLRPGEKVSQYPQLSLHLPPEARALLASLATITGEPQWRVVDRALTARLQQLTREDQELAVNLAVRLLKQSRSRLDDVVASGDVEHEAKTTQK